MVTSRGVNKVRFYDASKRSSGRHQVFEKLAMIEVMCILLIGMLRSTYPYVEPRPFLKRAEKLSEKFQINNKLRLIHGKEVDFLIGS